MTVLLLSGFNSAVRFWSRRWPPWSSRTCSSRRLRIVRSGAAGTRSASRVIEVEAGQRAVDTGPYAIVRHPMYAAIVVMAWPRPSLSVVVLGSGAAARAGPRGKNPQRRTPADERARGVPRIHGTIPLPADSPASGSAGRSPSWLRSRKGRCVTRTSTHERRRRLEHDQHRVGARGRRRHRGIRSDGGHHRRRRRPGAPRDRDLGNRGSVILLPGTGYSATAFSLLGPELARRGYRAIAVNPRGVGRSTGPLAELTYHDYAADVGALIDRLAGGRAHVLGWAWGNRIARTLASDAPPTVASVVLIAAGGKVPADPVVAETTARLREPTSPSRNARACSRCGCLVPDRIRRLC